ncbi:hypothetical protein ACCS33_35825, partial [Rhizobium ruizarguesonis]
LQVGGMIVGGREGRCGGCDERVEGADIERPSDGPTKLAADERLGRGRRVLDDGDRILADIESLGVDVSRFTTLQMNDEPTMDAITPTGTSTVSLWQTNSVAVKISALFGVTAGTPDALAVLTGIEWPTIVSG